MRKRLLTVAALAWAAACSAPNSDAHQPASMVERRPSLMADTTVYEAYMVTKHADVKPPLSRPAYPEALRREKLTGDVTVHFIVDTAGHAEPGSAQVTRTSHRLFSEAVLAALPTMRFYPAELNGHKVRQLVEQDFTFSLTP